MKLFKLRVGVLHNLSHVGGCLPVQISEFEQRHIAASAEYLLHLGPQATNRTVDVLGKLGKQVFLIEIFDPVLDGCASELRISERCAGNKRLLAIFILSFT